MAKDGKKLELPSSVEEDPQDPHKICPFRTSMIPVPQQSMIPGRQQVSFTEITTPCNNRCALYVEPDVPSDFEGCSLKLMALNGE